MDNLSGVRVLVVDDHDRWRRFLSEQLVAWSAELIGTAIDGFEAVHTARMARPDLIIMDVWMPGLNGLAATREIGTFAPETKILIISTDCDPAIAAEAFAAGARGYILKSLAGIELLKAIEAIVGGKRFIGSGLIGSGPRQHEPDVMSRR